LDSKVEERGNNLSVGERQLIAFARVLAFDPDILILDEATANIDSLSEQLIQQATERVIQGRTSIIIAHRLSTILGCDRIAVLDKGQLIEVGSHEELLTRQGKYFSLYQSQFRDVGGESLADANTPVPSPVG
jgi:ATP-binding cassette subfamily B protein